MVITHEENIIKSEIYEESANYAEIYDCGRFFIPAEINISDEKIGW